MARRLSLIGLYLGGALLAGVLLVNADAENGSVAVGIWSTASVLLGWSLARWTAALLPLASIPMALPFGYANDHLGSDAPLVWLFAVVAGTIAAGLILVATGARKLYERRRSAPAGSDQSPIGALRQSRP